MTKKIKITDKSGLFIIKKSIRVLPTNKLYQMESMAKESIDKNKDDKDIAQIILKWLNKEYKRRKLL